MAVVQLFRFSVLLVLSQLLCRGATQQCRAGGSEQSVFGWMLKGHIYKTMMADLGHVCLLACRQDDRCQSFNFVISRHMCEFSDRTKEARPEDFIPDPDRFYFRRDINRVPLGSILDLPAETCEEIQASEGAQAVSGKYWLSTIKPGMSVLAHCDMEPDGCQTYQSLTSADRKVTHVATNAQSDKALGPGWFRFQGDAGKTMAASCPPVNMCNTNSPGWLNGLHPLSEAEGSVTRRVCFHMYNNCCHWSTRIRIRNCGSYFVYYLNGIPVDYFLRYCGSD